MAEEASGGQHNGDRCLKLITSTNQVTIVQTISSLTAGEKYLCTYWSKNESATAASGARHKVYDLQNTEEIIAVTASGNETTGWVQTVFQFTVPTDCISVNFFFYSPTGDKYALVDDVVVTVFQYKSIPFTADDETDNYLATVVGFYGTIITDAGKNGILEDASTDWVLHEEGGGTETGFTFSAANDRIEIVATTTGEEQGAKLTASYYSTIEMGRQYAVWVDLQAASGTPTVSGVIWGTHF